MDEPDKPDETPPKKKRPKFGGRKPILQAELVAAAIQKYDGNLKSVAHQFKVTRQSVRDFIDKRPLLLQVINDAREGMKDEAESGLYKCIKKAEAWAICFFLKTQGADRGYGELSLLRKRVIAMEKKLGITAVDEPENDPETAGTPA